MMMNVPEASCVLPTVWIDTVYRMQQKGGVESVGGWRKMQGTTIFFFYVVLYFRRIALLSHTQWLSIY